MKCNDSDKKYDDNTWSLKFMTAISVKSGNTIA
jgi:hypothetical protein